MPEDFPLIVWRILVWSKSIKDHAIGLFLFHVYGLLFVGIVVNSDRGLVPSDDIDYINWSDPCTIKAATCNQIMMAE